jgi:ribosomal protein L37AE/L43A
MINIEQELKPTCPACESNAVVRNANGSYCLSCPWTQHHDGEPMGYPSPEDNTDMLHGEYIMQSVSEEVFPDDIETAKEVH